ncbi:LOW QUALITY PROTEIN: zinc finger CCCH domain-containing protein 18-like [Homalodisca vitripennis]|uniref:LOW QUALITY PROTEIN: zinc finger CCCH domain-containing protein 18-like n=1 Tax=Homalodisca vitripennis TaxID=197043 RepID=UPI001EE9D914|nr:LOW QUALITY PROTEIN: zinc finger CCCH domain-containing protein 18-like [Homalodisca vitripennis]
MDSDSSMDEERNRNRWNKQDMVPIRPNMNDDNSDVSDEENISRAARSIESPPESPQGTHFESPPASPDPENKPGTPSPIQSPDDSASYYDGSPPKSPDSQADSRHLKNDSPPRSPDSCLPRSPSPVRFTNRSPPSDHRSQSPTTNYPRSPSPLQTRPTRNKSPDTVQSPSSIQSPTPASHYDMRSPSSLRSPSPYQSRGSESPRDPRRLASESPGRSQSSPRQNSPRRFKGRRSPSQSPVRQRSRKDSNNSDDGRSNISSASSFSSPRHSPPPRPRTPPQPSAPPRVKTVAELKSHVEDLSDVSDLESLNSMSDDEPEKPQPKENGDIRKNLDSKKESSSLRNTSSGGLEADDPEQLDFEAEEKEEGECDGPSQPAPTRSSGPATEAVVSEDEGELKGDELEEGEITDEGENRPEETEPRPICRFYNRGQCTWGASCRFVHPGVTDKGNYTMFEMVRPLVPVNGPPPMYGPPMDPYRPIERPMMGPPVYQQQPPVPRKEEAPPLVESAWERGLRQAKEMLRKSSKRKETEVDFEEKKMNLSLGQDELDKENDYYTRTASPVPNEEPDRWGAKMEGEPKRYRTMSDRFDDYGGGPEGYFYSRNTEQVWHQRPHYDESMRGVYGTRSSGGGKYYSRSSREKEYYSSSSSKRQKYSQREVIVQRQEKANWKDDRLVDVLYGSTTVAAVVNDRNTPRGKLLYRGKKRQTGRMTGQVSRCFVQEYYSSSGSKRQKYSQREVIVQRQEKANWKDQVSRCFVQEYYSSSGSKRQKYSQREVIVQRQEKANWKDDSPPARPSRYAEGRTAGGRGDEWADPWMRSKTSPLTRKQRSRKQSYSSGSSYSSSSRSSRSSSSSYSRSRSRSRSSRSRSREKPTKMSPPRRLLRTTSPLTRGAKVALSPALLSEKKATTERSILMNPPPPSPRTKVKGLGTNPSPPVDRVRAGTGVPSRLLAHSKAASAVAAAMRSTRSGSKSSRSSSNSDSSGSSSDSSDTSFSSSSSSRPASPLVRQKRIVIDERFALAQAMKVKAMDALKLSGQKQQIKLTLKGSNTGERVVPMAAVTSKKRPAESPPMEFSPPKAGSKATPKKAAPSRREELLKQLKAVEDAIARKRSKIS